MSRSPLTPAIERARALISSGDLGSAQVLLERAVELGRENLGEDDPDVLTAQRELAGVFLQSDDPMAARRMLEDAYAAGQWRLGDSDPLMLHISHDLGVVAQELGNRHEARKAFGRVAANGPAALGEGHRFVVQARSYLGEDPSGATVRPDAPPTQPAPVPSPAPPPPTVTPVADLTPAPPVNDVLPVPPVSNTPPVNNVAAVLNPAVDVPPVPQPRTGEVDARAALERPTDVLPVTRPDGRSGNPWDAAPAVPEQRRPVQQPPQPVQQAPLPVQQAPVPVQQAPYPVQQAPLPVQQRGPQPVHQGGYGSVDNPQVAYQGGYPPPQHVLPQSTEWPTTPQVESGADGAYRKRAFAVGLTVVATLVALVAVGALVVVLMNREGKKEEGPVTPVATASAGPQLGGAPPTRVKLTDRGASIDVSWRDPSGGKAPFMITMAREGQQLKPVAQVGLGKTKTSVDGLNPKLQYCFAVVAVYTSDLYASSTQVCTERG
ncbi:fibronectin type III domain-containing protein [Actinoplanes sichuanensis]|uniref:Tetratricopeptide repeat protein n=1 Tax=Actinoplanes sichuanensis TaxID=512349 RepID=A0ABW4AN96_9ACTN|nr:tetratricopeptide repeat protein [Actinoplanes sichuanensis]